MERIASRNDHGWPALPLAAWKDTYRTLHLFMQVAGKVRLALTPKMNQWWNVPFYVTTRGLTTAPMPIGVRTLALDFDFFRHALVAQTSDGQERSVSLEARSVKDFHAEVMRTLEALGASVPIWPVPVEIPMNVPFDQDTEHATYDPEAAHRFWDVLTRIEPVLEAFRSRYRGKCSPVHFFWGSFDLAVSRFPGRLAPPRGPSRIERDAYDEEVSSLGFWPGDAWGAYDGADALLYSYVSPAPDGFATAAVRPREARFDPKLGEFVLPYEVVRTSADPAGAILEFAQTTYEAAASFGRWDRTRLDYPAESRAR
jgi:hypothetical protein